MQLPASLALLALALSANAQAFGGTPAGGASPGRTSAFPVCAKSCINPPRANFPNEISAFCKAVPAQDCCITNACSPQDKALAYQNAQQICDYVKAHLASFTCAPTKKTTTKATSSTHKPGTPNAAASSPSKSSSTAHQTSSTHISSQSSTSSTLRTSTRPSTSTSHVSTSTHPVVGNPPTSSTPSSSKGSSTSTAPPSAHSTLSVYDGYVGAYCYTEGTSGRTLNGASSTSANMTIETCLQFCEKLGWRYAGLENSNSCYCDYDVHNGGARTADSACNMGCSGNPSENCGGANVLSVYESG